MTISVGFLLWLILGVLWTMADSKRRIFYMYLVPNSLISRLTNPLGHSGGISDELVFPGNDEVQQLFKLTSCPSDVYKENRLMLASADYLFEGLNASVSLAFNGSRPIDRYLPNYRNPCWLERLPSKPFKYGGSAFRDTWPDVSQRNRTISRHRQLESIYRVRQHTRVPWRIRCLPYLFIAGVYKSGTTDFYYSLVSHPLVEGGGNKEPFFWTEVPPKPKPSSRSIEKYGVETFEHYLDTYDYTAERIRRQVPSKAFHPKITVDAATWTFFGYRQWQHHPWNRETGEMCISLPQHINYISPRSKVIIMLRNPVSWLTSCYNHQKRVHRIKHKPHSPADLHHRVVTGIQWFKDCLAKNNDNSRLCFHDPVTTRDYCHVKFTLHYIFVKEWMETLGKNKVMVINSDLYFANRVPVVQKAFSFLKLPPLSSRMLNKTMHRKVANGKGNRDKVEMFPPTATLLTDFVRPWTQLLVTYLGDESFQWRYQ